MGCAFLYCGVFSLERVGKYLPLGGKAKKGISRDLGGMTDRAVVYLMRIIPSYIHMDMIKFPTIVVWEGERIKKREQDFGYGKKLCIGKRWYTEGRMQGEVSAA